MELQKRKRGTSDGEGLVGPTEFQGQSFQSSSDVIAYLQAVENKRDRYSAQMEVLERMAIYHHRAGDMIEDVFAYIERDRAYTAVMSDTEFNSAWAEVRVIVVENQKRRDKSREATSAAKGLWEAGVVDWLQGAQPSGYFMTTVRSLAKLCDAKEGALRVNRAMITRLSNPRKGISTKKSIQAVDVADAKGLASWEEATRGELRRLGLRIGACGFLEEGECLEIEGTGGDGAPHFPSPAREMDLDQASDGSALANIPDPEDDFSAETRDEMIDEELLEGVGVELEELELEGSEPGSPSSGGGVGRSRCGCSSDVTRGWKVAVSKGKSYEMGTNLKLLKAMVGFRRVCYPHSKAMGGHMGLRIKQLSAGDLRQRLEQIHENRLEIGKLKTDKGTFSWFRMKNRPPRASDALGPYKFKHDDYAAGLTYTPQAVLDWVGGVDIEAWHRDGSVNVDLFSWWFKTEIGSVVLTEFDAYRHHLREINGKSNYGWLRNMFYSIGQQLMRQDPVYYAVYAALRPDRQWRLVSYPYYAKFAVKGDNTYFRHLDLNIPELLANSRGCNMIQGSVSLDDEDGSSCTVILPGMQHKLGEWWERVVGRGQETGGFVHRITEQMFTREDAQALGVDWKRVPCRRGGVRITLPHLPHGADGPATQTRRTMLPWLVGLQDDLSTLEVVEGGTWEMLSSAHRDMVSPAATPSGLANRYGAIPYKFPAAVEVAGLGALSDALVCRRRWDSALVLQDRDTLLNGTQEKAAAYVEGWRARAVAAAKEAFVLFIQTEKHVFGEKSYFFHLDRLQHQGIHFPEIEPDDESSSEEGGGGGGSAVRDRKKGEGLQVRNLDFAEAGLDTASKRVT
jgi:hypothetical protein